MTKFHNFDVPPIELRLAQVKIVEFNREKVRQCQNSFRRLDTFKNTKRRYITPLPTKNQFTVTHEKELQPRQNTQTTIITWKKNRNESIHVHLEWPAHRSIAPTQAHDSFGKLTRTQIFMFIWTIWCGLYLNIELLYLKLRTTVQCTVGDIKTFLYHDCITITLWSYISVVQSYYTYGTVTHDSLNKRIRTKIVWFIWTIRYN